MEVYGKKRYLIVQNDNEKTYIFQGKLVKWNWSQILNTMIGYGVIKSIYFLLLYLKAVIQAYEPYKDVLIFSGNYDLFEKY